MDLQQKIQNIYQTSKNYPELVSALIGIGIRSYTVEVASSNIVYRFAEGENLLHDGNISPRQVGAEFNLEQTMKAVKDTQQGKLNYPEFMDAIAKSGIRFYEATLEGKNKRVTYIGSGGHYEELIPL